MLKSLMSVAALASIATAPVVAQAAPFAAPAAVVADQDNGGSTAGGMSNVGYVALAVIVVIGVFVGLGISDNDNSTSP